MKTYRLILAFVLALAPIAARADDGLKRISVTASQLPAFAGDCTSAVGSTTLACVGQSVAGAGSNFSIGSTGGGATNETFNFKSSYAGGVVVSGCGGVAASIIASPDSAGGRLIFLTCSPSNGLVERMRFDSAGNTLIKKLAAIPTAAPGANECLEVWVPSALTTPAGTTGACSKIAMCGTSTTYLIESASVGTGC